MLPILECVKKEYETGSISESVAIDFLTNLFEHSCNEEIRIDILSIVKNIKTNSQKLFKFLENILISDSNFEVRKIAIEIIDVRFIDISFDVLKWAMIHEDSIENYCLIVKTISKINSIKVREFFIEELGNLKESIKIKYEWLDTISKYEKLIRDFKKNKKINKFSTHHLGNILINYQIIANLIKKYPNVAYELDRENGLVISLDLSDLAMEPRGLPIGWKNNIRDLQEIKYILFLSQLKTLNLANNQIHDISGLEKLTNLTHLYLENNKIRDKKTLKVLNKMNKLQLVDLHGNAVVKKLNIKDFNLKIKVILNSYLDDLEKSLLSIKN